MWTFGEIEDKTNGKILRYKVKKSKKKIKEKKKDWLREKKWTKDNSETYDKENVFPKREMNKQKILTSDIYR